MQSTYLRTLPVILVDPAPDLEAALHLQLRDPGAALLQHTVTLHLAALLWKGYMVLQQYYHYHYYC